MPLTRRSGYDYCAHCDAESDLYRPWPTCRGCDEPICANCALPGTTTDVDLDAPETCGCLRCVADALDAPYAAQRAMVARVIGGARIKVRK